jgi:hypothetical protein
MAQAQHGRKSRNGNVIVSIYFSTCSTTFRTGTKTVSICIKAAKRRVDAAETIFNELASFFHRGRTAAENGETDGIAAPTEKQAKRDFNSLLRGKHDGKLVIESVKPKLTGGKRKIIDQTFKDRAEFKESEEGEIRE